MWLIIMSFVLLMTGCASKAEVVYLESEDMGRLKKIKEVCEAEGIDEVCKEIYVKVVPVKKESLYEKERKETLLKLLRKPPAPVRTPDEVLKIYVLPYTDAEGNFHAGGYIFTVVKDGEWILSGKGMKEEPLDKVLTPLEDKK